MSKYGELVVAAAAVGGRGALSGITTLNFFLARNAPLPVWLKVPPVDATVACDICVPEGAASKVEDAELELSAVVEVLVALLLLLRIGEV